MAMRLSGRQIGLLKEYMHDLVEQAKQDEATTLAFGYAVQAYRSDQAISDLLAILDDRIESEGVQVGLPVEFLHQMWTLCNQANSDVEGTVWLQRNLDGEPATKSRVRDLTYRALIEYLEHLPEEPTTAYFDE
ncbi:MAG: hypothetical protein O3A59_09440 [Nitrospirae bacterium]|nr:hypothetical protein [Nitrospirota bacterium]